MLLQRTVSADQLRPLLDSTEETALRLGLHHRQALKLRLIVEELYTNLLWHLPVSADGAPRTVTMSVGVVDGDAVLSFADDGPIFDPLSVPSLAEGPFATAEFVKEGGLGIALVRGLAADCKYERRDERNVLTMTVAR